MSRVESVDVIRAGYQDEGIELCRRYGIDDMRTLWIEYDVIDLPLLRFGLSREDADGRIVTDEHGEIVIDTVDRALVGDLPDWWDEVAA